MNKEEYEQYLKRYKEARLKAEKKRIKEIRKVLRWYKARSFFNALFRW